MAPVINSGIPPLITKQEITTVFVGNITDKVSDTLVRQILMKCGYIISWKRVQGASGRLQAFGFCEYAEPESGLRAMRILSGFEIGDKKLLAKVDSKTREQLDRYKEQKKIEKEVLSSGSLPADYDIETDAETQKQDEIVLNDIEKLLRDNLKEMDSGILQTFKKTHSGNTENLEGLDMNDDTKSLVAKEIRGFRQTYKEEEKKRDKEKERDNHDNRDSRDRDRHRDERSKDRDHDREKDRQREKDREREREKDRDREREREREREQRERERRRRERDEREERDRRREKSDSEPPRRGTPSRMRRSRSKSMERDDDDYESKRLERIRKVKDGEYMEKLKEWEARERKKTREYEKQVSKEDRKKSEEDEEKHRLLEFLEDYDDDRDDIKYYKGSAFARRMRDRELEIQADNRDKQREMEEIEEVFRKQMSGEIIEVKKPKLISEEKKENEPPNLTLQEKEENVTSNPNLRPAFSTIQNDDSSPVHIISNSPSPVPSPVSRKQEIKMQPTTLKREHNGDNSPLDAPSSKKFGFGMKFSANVANKNKLGAVFNSNEDEVKQEQEPKKKLTRLDEANEQKEQPSVDDKRKLIKNLIEKIPTVKEELFAYPLKWEIVEQSLVEKRIKPWVNKKIFEYIGEEETTLVDFICSKVLSKSNAKSILEDVAMVLDEESEVFVVKMWRLLIYETEAKCLGLVK